MPVMAPRTEAEAFYYPNYNRCMENAEKERKADQRKSLLKRFGISPEEATIEKLWEIIFILADEADLGKESRRMIAEITSELEQLEDGMVSKKQRFIQYLKKIFLHQTSEKTKRIIDEEDTEESTPKDVSDTDESPENGSSETNTEKEQEEGRIAGKDEPASNFPSGSKKNGSPEKEGSGKADGKKYWNRRPQGCGTAGIQPDERRKKYADTGEYSAENPPLDKNGNPMVRHEIYVRTEYGYETKLVAYDIYKVVYESVESKKENPEVLIFNCPPPLFHRTMCTPEFLARINYNKYGLSLPYYRQEKEWARLGFPVSRDSMAKWSIRAYEKAMKKIINRYWYHLKKEKYLHADETNVLVMKESDRKDTTKSYIWIYCTAEAAVNRIVIFDYQPGRKGEFAEDALQGFSGWLITDAYGGYNGVKDIIRCLCWCHCRRKYTDALPADPKRAAKSRIKTAVKLINKLFKLEEEFKGMTAEERLKARKEQSQSVLDELWSWAEKTLPSISKKSALYDAIQYMQNNWEGLTRFMENGNLPIHNQQAEHMAKALAVSRKNWMLFGSPKGASAGMAAASVIKTAELNQIDPLHYLEFLYNEMRGPADDLKWENPEYLDSLMPWSENVKSHCRHLKA